MCSVQWNVTIPRSDVSSNLPSALSAMKQLCSSECYRKGAVLSGPGTDDDDDDDDAVSCRVTCGAVWVVS
jgi:hypothetical protein